MLFIAILFLAYWNGANDNFKGVATLYGSGTVGYKTAIAIATVSTFAGSIAAIFLARGLIAAFSGKGLVPDNIAGSGEFLTAVALGSSLTVLSATRLGLPISTTHSLVGALLGAGLIANYAEVNLALLGSTFFLPLLVSPLLALLSALTLYRVFSGFREYFGLKKETCLCVGKARKIVPLYQLAPAGQDFYLKQHHGGQLQFKVAEEVICQDLYAGKFAGMRLQRILDYAHIASASIVSFARGLNDTPKIAALAVAVSALNIDFGMLAIGIAIAVGGIVNARRVAETISHRITSLTHGQGFSANLVTGLLVILASRFGIPVSTTHVSIGAIFGIGMVSDQRDLSVIRDIVLSWLGTLPVAVLLSALSYGLLMGFVS